MKTNFSMGDEQTNIPSTSTSEWDIDKHGNVRLIKSNPTPAKRSCQKEEDANPKKKARSSDCSGCNWTTPKEKVNFEETPSSSDSEHLETDSENIEADSSSDSETDSEAELNPYLTCDDNYDIINELKSRPRSIENIRVVKTGCFEPFLIELESDEEYDKIVPSKTVKKAPVCGKTGKFNCSPQNEDSDCEIIGSVYRKLANNAKTTNTCRKKWVISKKSSLDPKLAKEAKNAETTRTSCKKSVDSKKSFIDPKIVKEAKNAETTRTSCKKCVDSKKSFIDPKTVKEDKNAETTRTSCKKCVHSKKASLDPAKEAENAETTRTSCKRCVHSKKSSVDAKLAKEAKNAKTKKRTSRKKCVHSTSGINVEELSTLLKQVVKDVQDLKNKKVSCSRPVTPTVREPLCGATSRHYISEEDNAKVQSEINQIEKLVAETEHNVEKVVKKSEKTKKEISDEIESLTKTLVAINKERKENYQNYCKDLNEAERNAVAAEPAYFEVRETVLVLENKISHIVSDIAKLAPRRPIPNPHSTPEHLSIHDTLRGEVKCYKSEIEKYTMDISHHTFNVAQLKKQLFENRKRNKGLRAAFEALRRKYHVTVVSQAPAIHCMEEESFIKDLTDFAKSEAVKFEEKYAECMKQKYEDQSGK